MNQQLQRAVALLKPAPSSQSILPFIPRPIRIIAFVILLLNIRSWPTFWHYRVFWPLIRLRLIQVYYAVTFQRKAAKLWVESIRPNGQNPLTKRVVMKGWASPDDCDYNMHLSNSSYPKILDMARFKGALAFFPSTLKDGTNLFLAGTHFNFIREIPINSPYEIRLHLGGWDQKWMYIIAQFAIPPTSIKKKKDNRTRDKGKALADGVAAALSEHTHFDGGAPNLTGTPSTPFAVDTPPATAGLVAPSVARQPVVLEDGWILATSSVSILVCKAGGSTVPPALALACDGFLLSDSEWATVQRLRRKLRIVPGKDGSKGKASGSTSEIKYLLRGGWREVVAAEAKKGKLSEGEEARPVLIGDGVWWDEVMKREGVQKQVDENMKALGSLRDGIEGAREISLNLRGNPVS